MNGDLWSWAPGDAAPQQLTTWGYVTLPRCRQMRSASPQRLGQPPFRRSSRQPVTGVIPSNIAVLDLATGQSQTIADQPAGVAFDPNTGWQSAIMRGQPAWSPDGTRLAWSEFAVPENVYRLVVYDLAAAQQTVIVPNLPMPYADAGNIPVHRDQWSTWGISVHTVAVNPESGDFEERVTIYDALGAQLAEHLIGSSVSEFTLMHVWVEFEGVELLGLLYPSGKPAARSGQRQAVRYAVTAAASQHQPTGPSAALTPAEQRPEATACAIVPAHARSPEFGRRHQPGLGSSRSRRMGVSCVRRRTGTGLAEQHDPAGPGTEELSSGGRAVGPVSGACRR